MRSTQIPKDSNRKGNISPVNDATSSNKFKGQPKYVPQSGTKPSLVTNIAINILFGFGLYCLYKDYSISKSKADSAGIVKIVEEPRKQEGRIMTSEERIQSPVGQMLSSLTYRDISAFSVTMGFLGYIADVTRQSFGKKSILFKVSLLSLFLFPSFSYVFYKYNFDKSRRKISKF